MTNRFEAAHARPIVVGDFAAMNLVGKTHALAVKDIQDGVPTVGGVMVAVV